MIPTRTVWRSISVNSQRYRELSTTSVQLPLYNTCNLIENSLLTTRCSVFYTNLWVGAFEAVRCVLRCWWTELDPKINSVVYMNVMLDKSNWYCVSVLTFHLCNLGFIMVFYLHGFGYHRGHGGMREFRLRLRVALLSKVTPSHSRNKPARNELRLSNLSNRARAYYAMDTRPT